MRFETLKLKLQARGLRLQARGARHEVRHPHESEDPLEGFEVRGSRIQARSTGFEVASLWGMRFEALKLKFLARGSAQSPPQAFLLQVAPVLVPDPPSSSILSCSSRAFS